MAGRRMEFCTAAGREDTGIAEWGFQYDNDAADERNFIGG